MGFILYPFQRVALIGESEADADALAKRFVKTIDGELDRRRRRKMIVTSGAAVETLLFALKFDTAFKRFIADDRLIAELHELTEQRLDATRKVIKTSTRLVDVPR
jgi:hypothetical protein